ncbi:MAG TPA: glutamine--fructose-6-phosphate aminotransferase, partial [Phycicoccus sp.]|nr:glutamine--fructose-6-phosphate aminotransferase [Phycicoccus sp.]
MCGIVGYVGKNLDGKAQNVVMEGLARLEYRGYDSAGIALVTEQGLETEKRAGKLENLRSALEAHPLDASRTGIGHTRWATHGGPTDGNAHPHRGGEGDKLALIHNGIIENFHS